MTPVAFLAYLSSSLGLGQKMKRKVIAYDMVDLNIGNGYNKNTGKFTAPSDGLYLFHVSTGVYDGSRVAVELVLNGVIKDIGFPDSYDISVRSQVSTVTPLSLKKGDIVCVRMGNVNRGHYIESNSIIRTSFSGVKIM